MNRLAHPLASYLAQSRAPNALMYLGNPNMTPSQNFAANRYARLARTPGTEEYYDRVLHEQGGDPERAGWVQFAEMTGGKTPEQQRQQAEEDIRTGLDVFLGAGAAGRALDAAQAAAGNRLRQFFDPRQPRNVMPMTFYHGSPHRFDKFELSDRTIGSGEGAQAYGHGLYFAEDPAIAGHYQKVLGDTEIEIDGQRLRPTDFAIDSPERQALSSIRGGRDIESTAKSLREYASAIEDPSTHLAAADWLDSIKDRARVVGGNLYEVDIPDEQVARMLDWDAPLSEQPEMVRQLADDMGIAGPKTEEIYYQNNIRAGMDPKKARQNAKSVGNDPGMKGKQLYEALTHQARDAAIARGENAATTLGASQAKASDDLRALGIPGIKYYDAGSRAAGEGTRNVVVFDDSIIEMLKRNDEALK